jgi:hypothetical protein
MVQGRSRQGIKRPEREIDDSPLRSKVTNAGKFHLTPSPFPSWRNLKVYVLQYYSTVTPKDQRWQLTEN